MGDVPHNTCIAIYGRTYPVLYTPVFPMQFAHMKQGFQVDAHGTKDVPTSTVRTNKVLTARQRQLHIPLLLGGAALETALLEPHRTQQRR